MSKRVATENTDDNSSPAKRFLSSYEMVNLGRIRSLEELDRATLELQNKRLFERLQERRRVEENLFERIEQLEARQAKDDELCCMVNRHWNQLDEDTSILLRRFDSSFCEEEGGDDDESSEAAAAPPFEKVSATAESFLKQLNSCDKDEIDHILSQRVHFSKRIISRLISAFDRLQQRFDRIHRAVVKRRKVTLETSVKSPSSDGVDETEERKPKLEPKTPEDEEGVDGEHQDIKPVIDNLISTNTAGADHLNLADAVAKEMDNLRRENTRVHRVCGKLQSSQHALGMRLSELQDKLHLAEENSAEWKNKYEDLVYKHEKACEKTCKLERRLAEAQAASREYNEKVQILTKGSDGDNGDGLEGVAKSKFNELVQELEEQKELAANRLAEIELLQKKNQDKIRECESLRIELQELPASVIQESPEFKSLKQQFNILFEDASRLRCTVEQHRSQLENNRLAHLRNVELMEMNEQACQKQLRAEMECLEKMNLTLKRELETLELDFKQQLAHNEQAGPITSEMRNLISTLQVHNKQLKTEAQRWYKKFKDAQTEAAKYKNDMKAMEEDLGKLRSQVKHFQQQQQQHHHPQHPHPHPHQRRPSSESSQANPAGNSSNNSAVGASGTNNVSGTATGSGSASGPNANCVTGSSSDNEKHNHVNATSCTPNSVGGTPPQSNPTSSSTAANKHHAHSTSSSNSCRPSTQPHPSSQNDVSTPSAKHGMMNDSDLIKDLRCQLKKAQDSQKEMAASLELFKSVPREQREKVALLQSEQKLRSEVAELRTEVGRLREREKRLCGATGGEEALRRIRKLEETLHSYQNKLNAAKQEEEALLKEMEVTGQAFEDMQEQNTRLLGTLREKDDGNLKMMAERMKATQIHKLMKEEKVVLEEQTKMLQAQLEAQNQVAKKLEEKDHLLLTNVSNLEKEMALRIHSMEVYKRRAAESAQSAEDLRVSMDKYLSQLKELQNALQEKACAVEKEGYKYRRAQEELASLRKKYERLKKIEQSNNADEVLLAEIQDYKDQLTCPSCKVRKKDGILTKCFHVFCLDCLSTRYNTRNRKCPKCNAPFGANDFHRLYLS